MLNSLSKEFIMLINVKTFISIINATFKRLKTRIGFMFYKRKKFYAHLSLALKEAV